MKTIWKFKLHITGSVEMPKGARPLHVAAQGDDLCLWALVDPTADRVLRNFSLGTGDHIPDRPGELPLEYIGTAMFDDGKAVWHVFDTGESSKVESLPFAAIENKAKAAKSIEVAA